MAGAIILTQASSRTAPRTPVGFARGRQNKFRHGTTRVGALVVGKWRWETSNTLELETEEWVSG